MSGQLGSIFIATVLGRALGSPVAIFAQNPPATGGQVRKVKSALLGVAVRRADRVICCAPHVAQAFVDRFHLDPANVRAVPNGIDPGPEPDRSSGDGIRAELTGSADARLVVNVGRIHPQKAQDDLIAAAILLAADGELHDVRLVIVGGTESAKTKRLEAKLVRQVERGGLSGVVHFVGYRHDVRAILEASDVFVLPSRWEGNSLSAMEAMAAACPAVLSDRAVPETCFVDPDHGLVVPVGDSRSLAEAVAVMLGKPGAERASIGHRARSAVIEHASIDRATKHFVAAVESLFVARSGTVDGADPSVDDGNEAT